MQYHVNNSTHHAADMTTLELVGRLFSLHQIGIVVHHLNIEKKVYKLKKKKKEQLIPQVLTNRHTCDDCLPTLYNLHTALTLLPSYNQQS